MLCAHFEQGGLPPSNPLSIETVCYPLPIYSMLMNAVGEFVNREENISANHWSIVNQRSTLGCVERRQHHHHHGLHRHPSTLISTPLFAFYPNRTETNGCPVRKKARLKWMLSKCISMLDRRLTKRENIFFVSLNSSQKKIQN